MSEVNKLLAGWAWLTQRWVELHVFFDQSRSCILVAVLCIIVQFAIDEAQYHELCLS